MCSSTSGSAEPTLAIRQYLGSEHGRILAADILDFTDDLSAEGIGIRSMTRRKQACTLAPNCVF
jgi:hypothetical protein